ncbi:MAG TPA: glycosyltransferase family A protein [Pyrinomonadaceae bacterium]
MRVSVIIPLFNKAPYIERALRSVAAQTFADFEIIVVDDGSTDGGLTIVEKFTDARLHIVRQQNAGPGAARNRGLREACGEFVAFLDADDEWLPEYLGESVRLLDEYPEAATVTSGYFAFPRGKSCESLWRSRGLSDGIKRLTAKTDPRFVLALLPYMTPCTTVVRAHAVRRWGGFYQTNRCKHAEDAHLWLKVLMNESVIVNLRPLACIHFEASSPTQTRRALRPVEPFLIHPEEIEACCPPDLRELLSRVLASRALKTACVLGYWGEWRAARDLRRKFAVAGSWQLPKYIPSQLCSTPFGSAMGKAWRALLYSQT